MQQISVIFATSLKYSRISDTGYDASGNLNSGNLSHVGA